MFMLGGKKKPGPDSYTVLQLSFDGTDGATTTTDDTGRHTITFNGNAQIDTAQSKFGGSSLLLDGTGDYLTIADSSDWDFSGGGDWTIEGWMRLAANGNRPLFSQITDVNNYFLLEGDNTGGPAGPNIFALSGGSPLVSTGASGFSPSTGVWYHFCFEKSGTTYRVYIDGDIKASVVDSDNFLNFLGNLNIGAALAPITVAYFNGWLDEIRISKGIARYNGTFTPPSSPFPD